MLYPIRFQPVYKNYIWGGRNLQKIGKKLPEGDVAESWELSCHPDGMSIVENGDLKGRTLQSLVDEFGTELVGVLPSTMGTAFPLLIKLIDANDRLSVQVHPDDAYALSHEGGYGKNEMWYILDAKRGATLVMGMKPGITRESFKKAVSEKRVEECLNTIPVKAGDFVHIPAGMVHAIGKGIVLAEIQQNSNTTYRIYDYDRTDAYGNQRPLHLEKAMEVIDFQADNRKTHYKGLKYNLSEHSKATILVANPYFCTELLSISGKIRQDTLNRQFHSIICIEGNGKIEWKTELLEITAGETVLIPSSLGEYCIRGRLEALKAYVPDLDVDIFDRLQKDGFSEHEILTKINGLPQE